MLDLSHVSRLESLAVNRYVPVPVPRPTGDARPIHPHPIFQASDTTPGSGVVAAGQGAQHRKTLLEWWRQWSGCARVLFSWYPYFFQSALPLASGNAMIHPPWRIQKNSGRKTCRGQALKQPPALQGTEAPLPLRARDRRSRLAPVPPSRWRGLQSRLPHSPWIPACSGDHARLCSISAICPFRSSVSRHALGGHDEVRGAEGR